MSNMHHSWKIVLVALGLLVLPVVALATAPDLVLENVSVVPLTPTTRQQTRIIIEGSYQGERPLTALDIFSSLPATFDRSFARGNVQHQSVEPIGPWPLLPGERFFLIYNGYFSQAGEQPVTVGVYADGQISEPIVSNNVVNTVVTVGDGILPDLAIREIMVASTTPYVNATVTVRVVVRNEGIAGVTDSDIVRDWTATIDDGRLLTPWHLASGTAAPTIDTPWQPGDDFTWEASMTFATAGPKLLSFCVNCDRNTTVAEQSMGNNRDRIYVPVIEPLLSQTDQATTIYNAFVRSAAEQLNRIYQFYTVITVPSQNAVHLVSNTGQRVNFLSPAAQASWLGNSPAAVSVHPQQLGYFQLSGALGYRFGSIVATDRDASQVYMVGVNRLLHPIGEHPLVLLFGVNWRNQLIAMSEVDWAYYQIGPNIK